FHELAERLHSVLQFDFLGLVLHDPSKNTMRLHVLETRGNMDPPPSDELSMEDSPAGWVWQNQQPFVSLDTSKDARYPLFMQRVQSVGVHTIAIVPLITAHHRLGAMGFGRYVPQAMTQVEIEFMKRVAAQVAVAVDNAINFEAAQARPSARLHQPGPPRSGHGAPEDSCPGHARDPRSAKDGVHHSGGKLAFGAMFHKRPGTDCP